MPEGKITSPDVELVIEPSEFTIEPSGIPGGRLAVEFPISVKLAVSVGPL